MTKRHSLTRALLATLLTGAGAVRAAEPPAPAPTATAPAAAPTTTPPAAPALAPAPAPAPAAEPAPVDALAPVADSDESPAIAPPNTSPSVLFDARQPGAPRGHTVARDRNAIDDGQRGTHQEHWLIGIGLRESYVTHTGFDLFSSNNALPQFSLNAGRTVFASGPLSFAALLAWDWGSAGDTARGAPTRLTVNRVTLGAEGRYHVWRRFYAFGRIAPGLLTSAATIQDSVAGVESVSSAAVFATDLSLGAALEFAGDDRGASSRPRGWIGAEGGYGWAQATKLSFKPDPDAKPDVKPPVRLEPLSLGELAVRGAFFRLTATLTY